MKPFVAEIATDHVGTFRLATNAKDFWISVFVKLTLDRFVTIVLVVNFFVAFWGHYYKTFFAATGGSTTGSKFVARFEAMALIKFVVLR